MDELVKVFEAYPVVNYVLVGLGTLVVVATVVIKLTPSKADDAILEKGWVKAILSVVERFSLVSRK